MPDVVILGAGAMGSATAWWLARRGREVVLLEQFEQGHAKGSSHGGSRIFRLAYDEPAYVRMAQESLPLWRELEADTGRIVARHDRSGRSRRSPVGGRGGRSTADLRRGPRGDSTPPRRVNGGPACGSTAMSCSIRTVVDVAPTTRSARCRTAPRLSAPTFASDRDEPRCARHRTVSKSTPPARRSAAPVAVVTAGAWVREVVDDELAPDVKVTQEQIQHFAPRVEGEWPSFIHHRRPWVYGLLTPGEGVKVAEHHVGPVVDPDRRPPRDVAAEATVVRYVEDWFPGLDPDPVNVAECLYTTTPDESFVIERRGPVVIGSPCSGHGFKFTPLIGRRLADLASLTASP